MDRNSNAYTFLFVVLLIAVVASALALTATALQPEQAENVKNEKMQNILGTVGIEVARDSAQIPFDKYIVERIALDSKGQERNDVDAFTVDLKKELKKDVEEQAFPLYVADIEGAKYYIVPLRGKGLWDAIWGYIALKDDVNTIKGAVFDHKAETPGLGAEITQGWFKKRFDDEKIFDGSGNFIGVSVAKGYQGGENKDDNAVDAISGATITGDGVTDMISERLVNYLPYFKNNTNVKVAAN
ncbi:Na+-transporting NADH:ubiquinone oxidoreductase subunit C [Nonlabens dokdonensis]|jgi:Na+-transporting NADH:ubiquinone oxidoreductase subunit C|uniref:Na(+)-translocating NADH-quinone reductase subunit C n=2 Tax=Nonlabens dokdonensis TaxID=328515 RepID=L7WAU0_NONDD|nr:NADH:ubiquinone reductase (Na(+)-transporting) subunit C [Nonlabens dokdonensis]AGC76996.1 Na(+)-translocating NADH-quinone reductase subunit C [Nonlabens dokdonensis DSW-6]PZX36897.1 Na+-transporting NADH:ubiquinone oxidoreductase subunit C [Nonlabens dokdonensis]